MPGNERPAGRSRFPPLHAKTAPRPGHAYKLLPSNIPCQYFPTSNFRSEPSPEAVRAFLDTHPEFLARYVRERVPSSRVRHWLLQKRKAKISPGLALNRPVGIAVSPEDRNMQGSSSPQPVAERRKLLEEIIKDSHNALKKPRIFALMKDCLSNIVQADGLNLYIADGANTIVRCYPESYEAGPQYLVGPGSVVAAFAAFTRRALRLPERGVMRSPADPRFPLFIGGPEEAQYVLSAPVMQEDRIAGVVELYRFAENEPFLREDEEIVQSYLMWGGTAVTCAENCLWNRKQERLNKFILQVTQSMFGKFKDKRSVIEDIMTHAKQLVNADRTSMFIVDRDAGEMVCMYFDQGDPDCNQHRLSEHDIRFSLDRGIAGHVAMTGGTCNIVDAYADPRFNRDVDQQTGYKTKSILCMPVKLHEVVIGVVQMLNKLDGYFTEDDEEHFKTFASYCGLALHIAKMYETIRLSEQKYKVALEVLSYHSQCTPEELGQLKVMGIPAEIPNINNFFYSPWSARELQKPQQVLFMFRDLFGFEKYDCETLMRFTLTVRKNYRHVPYHNWSHAFSVAHAMYVILKGNSHRFSHEEGLAMFIGSLCHDLDHRGKTNQFMVRSASPLAEIYSTSTMEHHHFNMTVAILQREGHNVFQYLDSEKYKNVLATIKHCILATDLERFENHRQRMTAVYENRSFGWDNEEHRFDLMAISMTTCDLCNMYKPWQLQVSLVLVIMDEFWTQGDEEKFQGEVPTKMMDREFKHELPESQVNFIKFVGMPCYALLARFLPEAMDCVNGAQQNMECWATMASLDRSAKDSELTQLEHDVRSWKVENLCFK